jgi:hypothetical protein
VKSVKYWTSVALISLGIIMFVLFAARFSGATTTSKRNSLGVVTYTVNPYLYEAGAIVDFAVIGQNEALSMRVKPLATYILFDENLLFCGVPVEKFDGHDNPMVLVYERQSHRLVNGIACHELIMVRGMEGDKP